MVITNQKYTEDEAGRISVQAKNTEQGHHHNGYQINHSMIPHILLDLQSPIWYLEKPARLLKTTRSQPTV